MINYKLLSDAIDFYKDLGYNQIDGLWTTPDSFPNYTLSLEKNIIKCNFGSLLNKSEQSLILALFSNKLENDKIYFSVNPCFEDSNEKFLMNLDLFFPNGTDIASENLTKDANKFFSKYILTDIESFYSEPGRVAYRIVDKQYRNELGIYGYRKHNNFSWAFGTGISLPNLSKVISLYYK